MRRVGRGTIVGLDGRDEGGRGAGQLGMGHGACCSAFTMGPLFENEYMKTMTTKATLAYYDY